MKRLLVLSMLLALAVPLVAGPAPAAAAKAKSCRTGTNFMVGPFLGFKVKARGVSCAKAKQVAKGWGRRQSCIAGGPNKKTCRVGAWKCRYGSGGYETSKVRCTKGRRRAVGFRAGS